MFTMSPSENERALVAILETAADGIVIIDDHGVVQSFNAAAERIFGYQAEEAIGQNVSMLMPPTYRDKHDGYIRRYLETSVPAIIGERRELVGQRRDGSFFPVELAVSDLDHAGRRLFTAIV